MKKNIRNQLNGRLLSAWRVHQHTKFHRFASWWFTGWYLYGTSNVLWVPGTIDVEFDNIHAPVFKYQQVESVWLTYNIDMHIFILPTYWAVFLWPSTMISGPSEPSGNLWKSLAPFSSCKEGSFSERNFLFKSRDGATVATVGRGSGELLSLWELKSLKRCPLAIFYALFSPFLVFFL